MESTMTSNADAKPNPSANYTVPLVILTSLFFIWGFLTVLNDILIPHFKGMFNLSHFQSTLVQSAFFSAYFVVSIPAGMLVNRLGYKHGVVLGLAIAGVGCSIFYPAASYHVFNIFLFALFVMAAGITILQVSANPYVTLLGPQETAPRRLTMTQAFNSFGTFIGPFIGSMFILSAKTPAEIAAMSTDEYSAHIESAASAVQVPYVAIAVCLFAIAVIFALLKNLPEIKDDNQDDSKPHTPAWKYPHLIFGVVGIFAYVGAEVSIGSLAVGFMTDPAIGNMTEKQAGTWLMLYWGGAMVGRFLGVLIMGYIKPAVLLAINAAVIIGLLVVGALTGGKVAMFAVLLVGLFNSIMFPTIFSLSIAKLGKATSQGSGMLCMAIVGGAIIPPLQGLLADEIGLQMSFLLPTVCYAYIIYFAISGHKVRNV